MTPRPIEPWFTEPEARELTDRIKDRAHDLWSLLLEAYERRAWKALGYKSWGSYYGAEFSDSGRRGYQLLDAARVLEQLEPPGFRGDDDPGSPLLNERTARELVPILRGREGAVADVYAEAVERHGPTPSAAQMREVVREHLPVRPPRAPREPAEPKPKRDPAWAKEVEKLRGMLLQARDTDPNALDDLWPLVERLWAIVCATRPSRTPG